MKCYELSQKHFGISSKETAFSILNLSFVKGNRGQLSGQFGAKKLRKRAIEMYKETIGYETAEVAESMFMLADVYSVEDSYQKALSLYTESYEIRKKIFSEESEEVAQSLAGLASIKSDLQDTATAEKYYLEALRIREKLHGRHHLKVALVCVNLGALYKTMGKLELTVPLYKRALEIRERKLGPKHPLTERIRKNFKRAEIDFKSKESSLKIK